MKKLIQTFTLASVAVVGLAATTALAEDRYDRGDGYGREGYDRRYDDRRYADSRYADRRYDDRRYDDRRYAARGVDDGRNYNRVDQACRRSSGTTGTIIGAIAGGLLGREIGRGGYRNQPSTTGLILGAGTGALAGRAIDKSASCDNRRYR